MARVANKRRKRGDRDSQHVAGGIDLKVGTSLEVSADKDGIVLRRQGRRARRPIAVIVGEIHRASYLQRNSELTLGCPVGKEIW